MRGIKILSLILLMALMAPLCVMGLVYLLQTVESSGDFAHTTALVLGLSLILVIYTLLWNRLEKLFLAQRIDKAKLDWSDINKRAA